MSQVLHNPRNNKAVLGGMGMYSGLREARIGWFNNQPESARRLIAHTNAMNMTALRSNAPGVSVSLLKCSSCFHESLNSNLAANWILYLSLPQKYIYHMRIKVCSGFGLVMVGIKFQSTNNVSV
jgi:hypothetical protein